ncbi:MAG: GGDEF domain-containing protein [Candidatus Izemoplasmatales bacterium]|jgi:diguanylate cyclase (GGDEF)-like protein|nr:GGDEF domain-containing protein [Candidatus Izemoplasmatales bacterium]
MKNHSKFYSIEKEYGIDLESEIYFPENHHIVFCYERKKENKVITILSGNPASLGFEPKFEYLFEEIAEHIETTNAIAEIEGKGSFLEDLVAKLSIVKQDTNLYIPLKGHETTVWILVGFDVITKNDYELVVGRISKMYPATPEAIIYYQKTYQDPLTRLFTRETLKNHIEHAQFYEGAYGLYFDIDNFKKINDFYGHHEGDVFLQQIANALIDNYEKDVIYYRLGGDEFFVYVINHTEQMVVNRAKNLIHLIETLSKKGEAVGVSVSIGIVPIKETDKDYQVLLDAGDKAMYRSKNRGKGQVTLLKDV